MGRGYAQSRTIAVTAAALTALLLAGCSDGPSLPRLSDLNPFAEKETPLPGKRIPVSLSETRAGLDVAQADKPIALPAPRQNEAWPQPGGPANNSPGHVVFGASPRQTWSASAGTGSSKQGRLTANPIVADGKVYTLDAHGRVSAFSASGAAAWKVSLTPDKEKDFKGFGGGLAAEGGRIYAATGFGIVYALDAQNGKKLWEKNLSSPVRSSPTAVNDRVFVVTSDGSTYALGGSDGRELWKFQGLPEKAAILTSASPAVDGDTVVVPYPSGDLVALRASDGQQVWSESLARTRLASSLNSMTDAARPVIDGGTVYAVGHSGRMVATNIKTGERLWSINVPGLHAPAVAGDMLYVVDTAGQLMAITRRDGKVLWTTKLSGATTWAGPVLAGGKLWLASDKGQLVGVDAATGRADGGGQNLGAPVFTSPIVAGGRMFVLTDQAKLVAFN